MKIMFPWIDINLGNSSEKRFVLKIYFLLIMLCLLSGCSTTLTSFFDDGESSQKRNEKLVVEDFKDEQAVFEKFKEIKNTPAMTDDQKRGPDLKLKPSPTKKRSDIRPPKIKKDLLIKNKKTLPLVLDLPIKPIQKVTEKKTINKTESLILYPEDYPEDYPEELKDFDGESETFWKDFRPVLFPGEEVVLNISYLGVNTGKITISTKSNTMIGDKNVYHMNARVKTASFYSYLYEVDDFCDSYTTQDTFIPLKFSLIQRQSTQDIDDLQLFDQAKLKAYSFYKRVTKEKTKKKKLVESIPTYFQDPLSIVYFIRGLPMKPDYKYSIPIINQGKVEILNAEFEKIEKIKTKLGDKDAYRVNVYTKHEGETLKGGSMIFWYSADDKRIFLKFDAKIKIGSVSGEIESYTN